MNTLPAKSEHDFFTSLFSPAMLDRPASAPAKSSAPRRSARVPVVRTLQRPEIAVLAPREGEHREDDERWDGLY